MRFKKLNIQVLGFTLFFIMSADLVISQCDYTTRRYEVSMESEVQYGISRGFDGQMDTLYLDVYKPVGDMNVKRPLIIWCFGGGFFTGDRDDFAVISDEMARRGYVSVTIDYRLGYVQPDLLPAPFAVDDKELLRAAYRAMQDAKGAIRFMKNRSDRDSTDLEEVFIGGASAGAIAALAATFIRDDSDLDQTIVGELPATMTNPSVARPDLGSVTGELNLGAEDASVTGVVNIFGALFDTEQIRPDDELAIYSYHQSGDPIVPCETDKAYWGLGFPGLADNMPFGSGSCAISDRLEELDYNGSLYETWIYDGNDHSIHNNDQVFGKVFDFLERQICRGVSSLNGSEPLTWKAYPNPFQGSLAISGLDKEESFLLFDGMGQLVKKIRYKGGVVYLHDLATGQYALVRVSTGEVATIISQ